MFEDNASNERLPDTYVRKSYAFGVGRFLSVELEKQRSHAVLWWPAGLAIGIGVFFALPTDPQSWVGLVCLIAVLAVRTTFKAIPWLQFLTFVLALASVGFCGAQLRTHFIHAPTLLEELGPARVTGTVIQAEPSGTAHRVTLDRLSISRLSEAETPATVRVRIPGSHGVPRVGQVIEVRSILRPPGRPVAPGAFDFQRYSYFRQLGGVGFAVGQWQSISDLGSTTSVWRDRVLALRADVGARLSKSLPDESGAVARALITGERNAVPEELQEAYRQAGLAHMLAISGLHMSLLTGLAFLFFRYGLALVMPIAERFDIKKLSAVIAFGAALFYLVLSGSNIPAQRAFIMVSVVLGAILIDRTALSLRTLAWAAMFVLLLQPEALVGASFQLSFAAVVALIAVYERVHLRSRLWDRYGNFQPLKALLLYALAVLVTDLIATSATAPFTAFHFHEIPSYSLLANLLAGPVMGLLIMPFGLIALLLMPFGAENIALVPMGFGIDLVDSIARFVSSLPGAIFVTPQAETWALICVSSGALMLALWQGRLRWFGGIPLLIGLFQPWQAVAPDIVIDEDAQLIAFKGTDGRLSLPLGRANGFTRGVWTEMWGRSVYSQQKIDGLSCDAIGCRYSKDGIIVSIANTEAAVFEDCGQSDVLVARVPTWQICKQDQSIDRFDVWRHGAHALWLDGDEIKVERVSDKTGRRAWNTATWR
jgi:competence protein ComEC